MNKNDTEQDTTRKSDGSKRRPPSRPAGKKKGRGANRRVKNRAQKNTAVAETMFDSPFGAVSLQRYPYTERDTLRAWDAADVYALEHLAGNGILSKDKDISILVFNDAFGGLSIPLHDYHPTVITDAYTSMQGIRSNLTLNDLDETDIRVCHSLQDLAEIFPGGVDVILIKIPKSNAMLDYQLHRLRDVLRADTVVIAAGMTRHIHNSTMDAFTDIVGDTHSTLAKKKARLILSTPDADREVSECAFPLDYEVDIQLPDPATGETAHETIMLSNHAGVFSATKLDLGTQLILKHMVADPRYQTIVDLGCGNGLLGIHAALLNPQAKIVFTDESYMAVDSAMTNFMRVFGDDGEVTREAEFLQTDCLQGVEQGSVDLVLCNPPFHQNNIITDSIAWRMFSESRDALRPGGELWVIGNRHLAYHAKLKHLFGNCETIASDKRFSLVKSTKKQAG